MATSYSQEQVQLELITSTLKLAQDLSPLKHQMEQHKSGMYITNDGVYEIHVYCAAHFKAYIPKVYEGWDVVYIEWNGGDIQIDIDEPIDISDY